MVSPCSLWFFLRWRLSSWRSVTGILINALGRLLCLWHMRTSVDLCGWSLELLRVLRLWLPWLIGRAPNIHSLVRKAWWRHPMEYRSCEMIFLRLWLIIFRRSRYKRHMILTCELIVSSWFLVPLQLLLVLTPWPFLEFFLLLGILRTMSMDLAGTYQLVLRPSFQWQLLASFPKISAIFVTAIMLGSLLKITPNLRAVGGLTNAIMISWCNTAMGSLLQEIFRRLRFRNPMGEAAFSDVCQAGLDLDPVSSGRIPVCVWHMRVVSSIFLWNFGRMRIFLIHFKGLKMIDDQISENPPKFNSEFTLKNGGKGSDDPAFAVKFRKGLFHS